MDTYSCFTKYLGIEGVGNPSIIASTDAAADMYIVLTVEVIKTSYLKTKR